MLLDFLEVWALVGRDMVDLRRFSTSEPVWPNG